MNSNPLYKKSCKFIRQNKLKKATKKFQKVHDPESNAPNFQHAKSYLSHLILNCSYSKTDKLISKIRNYPKTNISEIEKTDYIYSEALYAYHKGDFKEANYQIFKGTSKSTIFEIHSTDNYASAHDNLLLGNIYWKQGYYSQSFLCYCLAIAYFKKYDSNCVWIAKAYNMLAVLFMELAPTGNTEIYFAYSELLLHSALDFLKDILEDSETEQKCHLFIGCIYNDLANLYITKYSTNNGKEANKVEEYLNEAESNFKFTYGKKYEETRYAASIMHKRGYLEMLRGDFEMQKKEKVSFFRRAEGFFKQELSIRESLYPNNNNKPAHHPSIGRTYSYLAQVKLKIQELTNINPKDLSPIYEDKCIDFCQKAMYSVVNKFPLKKANKLKNPKVEKIEYVQSYKTFVRALCCKIACLRRRKDSSKLLENSINTGLKLIKNLRRDIVTLPEKSSHALETIIQPLNEEIIDYYVNLLPQIKEKKRLSQTIFSLIERGKNSLLTRIKTTGALLDNTSEIIIDKFILAGLGVSEADSHLQKLTKQQSLAIHLPNYEGYYRIMHASLSKNKSAVKFRKEDLCDYKGLFALMEIVIDDHFDKIKANLKKARIERDSLTPKEKKRKQKVRIPKLKDIKNNLGKINKKNESKTSLISFYYGKRKIYFQKITEAKVQTGHLSVNINKLETRIKSYLRFLNSAERQEIGTNYQRDGRWLFDKILGNLVSPKEKDFLILLPSGKLELLPFDVLITDEDEHQRPIYLVEQCATAYHFSVSYLNESFKEYEKQKKRNIDTLYVGLASEHMHNGLEKDCDGVFQEETVKSQEIIGKYFNQPEKTKSFLFEPPKPKKDWLSKENICTVKNVGKIGIKEKIKQAISKTRILEVFTHSNGEKLHIALSNEIHLNRDDFTNIKKIDLVILHGCNTGTGIFVEGEGILSLGRLFLKQQGIRSVIQNLLSIPYSSHKDDDLQDDIKSLFTKLILSNSKNNKLYTYPIALAIAKRRLIRLYRECTNLYDPRPIAAPVFYGFPLDKIA